MQYTQLDPNCDAVDPVKTLMEPISTDAVVRSAVRAVERLLVEDLDPRLQEVVGLWKSISDADQSLIFSIARSAVGNPVWGKDEVKNGH